MSIDINYHPEHFSNTSGNIVYQWWCLKCQDNHSTPYCPYDTFTIGDDYPEFLDLIDRIEICPHCGQIIKKEA